MHIGLNTLIGHFTALAEAMTFFLFCCCWSTANFELPPGDSSSSDNAAAGSHPNVSLSQAWEAGIRRKVTKGEVWKLTHLYCKLMCVLSVCPEFLPMLPGSV